MATKRPASAKVRVPSAPTVLSMFAGCGGMDLGFREAGFKLLWANEWNADAARTYRRNLCDPSADHMHEGDINEQRIPAEFAGRVDVLLGGFPCQAFSNAGSRRGVEDDRGLLYKHCIRYARELQPKFVMFENVRGMLTIQGRKKRFVEEVCDELVEAGYEVHLGLVNAAHYGVPQNRLRVVIVGVREGERRSCVFRFPSYERAARLTLGAVLEGLSADLVNQGDIMRLNPQAYEIGRWVPEGGSWKDISDKHLPERLLRIRREIRKYRWPNFYRRFSRKEIAGTITAAFKPENAGVWHPTEPRTFSVREIARIQSFPDHFVFEARSVKAMYQMIGNAVPPKMAQAFATAMRAALAGKTDAMPIGSYREVRRRGDVIRVSTGELSYQPAGVSRELVLGG